MEKTLSKEIVRGTELNVLIIGKNNNYDIYEIKNENTTEETTKGLECILMGFDISYDIALRKEEIADKFKNNSYDIVFIDDGVSKKDISELINIIRENDEGKKSLIIGLMNDEDKEFRSILNENNVELILFKPVKKGQIIVILRNDFKEKIILNY